MSRYGPHSKNLTEKSLEKHSRDDRTGLFQNWCRFQISIQTLVQLGIQEVHHFNPKTKQKSWQIPNGLQRQDLWLIINSWGCIQMFISRCGGQNTGSIKRGPVSSIGGRFFIQSFGSTNLFFVENGELFFSLRVSVWIFWTAVPDFNSSDFNLFSFYHTVISPFWRRSSCLVF